MMTMSKILYDAINNAINVTDNSANEIIEVLDKTRPFNKTTLSFTDLNIKGDLIINRGNKMTYNVVFYNCKFDNVKIIDSILINVNFIHCTIANLLIDSAYIEQCVFSNNTISYITLKKAKMTDCTIINSRIDSIYGSITMHRTTITDCYYDHIDLYKSYISSCGVMFMRKNRSLNYTIEGVSSVEASSNSFLKCRIYNTLITSSTFKRSYFYKCYIEMKSIDSIYDESYSYETKLTIGAKCPEEGSFIGYKKVDVLPDQLSDEENWSPEIIAVLEIPADAKRIGFGTDKCRCSKAKVLRFEDLKGDIIYGDIIAQSCGYANKSITYKVGEMVYPDSFDENKFNTCSNGIHFFMSKDDAIDY